MRKIAVAASFCALLLSGGVAGFYLGRETSSVRQVDPPLESARALVEELCRQQLPHEMSEADFLAHHADRFCTRRLKELLIKDHWKGQGFFEGYKQGQPDPLLTLKPPFADCGWFVNVTREGHLSVSAGAPDLRDGIARVEARFTCTIDAKTSPQGEQHMFLLRVENGAWRLDDVLWGEDSSLVRELSREKYM